MIQTFTTTHKILKNSSQHTAIVDGKHIGPFATEIELVRNLPDLKRYAHSTVSVDGSQNHFTHTWSLVK